MGWSYCGLDDLGREIGYGIPATCDEPECNIKIDRGLSYVCGHMHGEDEYSCARYFCANHQYFTDLEDYNYQVCSSCLKLLEAVPEEE